MSATVHAPSRPALRDRAANAPRNAFSIAEFGERNNVSRTFTYNEIKAGKLRAVKAGRRSLITAEDEAAWIESLPEARGE